MRVEPRLSRNYGRVLTLPISNGMRTVEQIYNEYQLMPILQMHQLRVAAVAQFICENFSEEIDSESVITACLFHDMGNILKSDFSVFPEAVEKEGIEYWQNVKDDYVRKYGKDEHKATIMIAKEIGLPEKVREIIDSIGFGKSPSVAREGSYEQKIAVYADARVGPHGVLSLADRLKDFEKRYAKRYLNDKSEEEKKSSRDAYFIIEKQIFSHTKISPQDITEEKISAFIPKLKERTI